MLTEPDSSIVRGVRRDVPAQLVRDYTYAFVAVALAGLKRIPVLPPRLSSLTQTRGE